jgi:L-lactate utilization protein LutB
MTRSTPFSAANLIRETGADARTWNILPSPDIVHRTASAIGDRGIAVVMAANGDDALAIVKNLIPPGAEVMTGSSTTLIEIGFDEYIAGGRSGWNSLHAVITSENDEIKRAELRRKSVTADWFVSGANAIAETGEIVACDAGGSRVGAWPFAAGHLILVAGTNKIVPSLEMAMRRVSEYAFRLENARAQRAYGAPSSMGKCVILFREKIPGRVTLVLINEALGY